MTDGYHNTRKVLTIRFSRATDNEFLGQYIGRICRAGSGSRALDKREYLMIISLPIESICCDPSSELCHGDDSDEVSQHNVFMQT